MMKSVRGGPWRIRRRYVEGEVESIAPELILFETLNALRYKGLFTDSRRRS